MMLSTRTTICCLVISLSLVASKCNGEGYEPAPNCAQYECPEYTVIQSHKEFEIRNYTEARWVYGPTIHSNSYKEAANKGFKMLLDYYKGQNRQHMTIDMTSPFLVRVDKSSYTVYFYLPKQNQVHPPQPLTNKIGLTSIPVDISPVGKRKYVAARRFDGLISDDTITTHLNALKKSLKSSPDYQRAAAGDVFMVAAYHSPFELYNRVSEVFIWFN